MVEKIKKEIERLKDRAEKHELLEKFGYKYGDSRTYETGLADAFDWILRFIESLEQKSQCDGCVNDKGCVTCVDGNMKETQPKGYDEAYLKEKIALAKKNGSWRNDSYDTVCNDIFSHSKEQEGLHFTPLGRLIQKLPWNDSTNSYAKKLVDCLVREGYTKDAQIVQEIVSYKNGYNVPMATMDEVHIQFNDKRTLPKQQPQGLDGQPKRKLRKVCNLREDLKADKPIEERVEELRQIRAEKDRLDEAAEDSLDSYADNIVEWEDKNPQWDKDTIRATAYRFYTLGKEAGAKWQLAKLKETCDIVDREYLKAAMEAEYERGRKEMAEQGWHEEAIIKGSNDVVWLNYNVELPIDLAKYFKAGDKVIVQIRKAD